MLRKDYCKGERNGDHHRKRDLVFSSTKILRGFSCYTDMHWEHSKQNEKAFQLEDNCC